MNEAEARKVALVRSLAEAILLQGDELLGDVTPPARDPETGACLHPEGQRLSAGRMGAPDAYVCRACGAEV